MWLILCFILSEWIYRKVSKLIYINLWRNHLIDKDYLSWIPWLKNSLSPYSLSLNSMTMRKICYNFKKKKKIYITSNLSFRKDLGKGWTESLSILRAQYNYCSISLKPQAKTVILSDRQTSQEIKLNFSYFKMSANHWVATNLRAICISCTSNHKILDLHLKIRCLI